MSKIQAFRLINVNYNHNATRISDECFYLQGESTLISLKNGGGKSVMVQMLTAPFVHKRYRDTKDRTFESYFTTNKPSFILVEWALDGGAGYVLTGMMVRKNQKPETEAESEEALEMIHFISEYREPCVTDLHHLPVVEKGEKEMVLKNFAACKQMFEEYKKDNSLQFFYYDASNRAQQRQYFQKLLEYQISSKEWETIIQKINQEESGLSTLFSDCKNEKKLVEKWFLDTIEEKLNQERHKMQEFQNLLQKYVAQYQDNQSKILRRDTIRLFQEEAALIREHAKKYQEEEVKEEEQMHLLARFIEELTRLKGLAEAEREEVGVKIEEILSQIARIAYEKLSSEIHTLEEELKRRISNRDLLEAEQEDLERTSRQIEKRLHLLACAKQQEFAAEVHRELEEIRQRIAVSKKEEAELEPERKQLGAALYQYYEREFIKKKQQIEENQSQYQKLQNQAEEEQQKLADFEQELREEASKEGALKSQVEAYSQKEEQYNTTYQEELVRNILGVYEPGALDIRKQKAEKELEACARERQQKRQQQELLRERQKSLSRSLQELYGKQIQTEMEKEQTAQKQEMFQEELKARKVVLQYLDLEESMLFEMDEILKASDRKLKELDSIRRNLEREEDKLRKEYQQLTEGKTLELPKELEAELLELGLPIVYGMEWLRKNQNSEEQNRKLVQKHPFLPYALLLSKKELQKLMEHKGEVYTSFPIPIMVREELEGAGHTEHTSVVALSGIHFYVLFNENLLNEEKLALLAAEKEQKIQKKQEWIQIRKKEYKESFERQERIKNQTVTKALYEENARALQELTELEEKQAKELQKGREEEKSVEQGLKIQEQELRECERELEYQKRRLADLERLCEAYQQYEQNRQDLERCARVIRRLEERKGIAQNSFAKLLEEQRSLEHEANRLERVQEQQKEKQQVYQGYADVDSISAKESAETLLEGEIEVMEARYFAITNRLSRELQDMEEQEQRAAKRYQDAAEDLERLRLKHRLEAEEWQSVAYNAKEELHQEALLEDCQKKTKKRHELWMEEQTAIAKVEQQKKDRIQRMQEVCGKKEPLSRQEIVHQDFEARKNELEYQRQEWKKQEHALMERLQGYEENLTALSEYSAFSLGEPVAWEQDFVSMSRQELRNFQGTLIRDYRQSVRNRQQAREQLVQVLNRIVRIEAFQEEFYKKPLEAMLELSDQAEQVLRQLSTTLQSYESLMEKLQVDISLVEKEKKNVVELLEEYIKEVHRNMDQIDSNSTITIRGRSIKMLKIELPSWEEQENLYQLRLQDLVDKITEKGLKLLTENKNIQEYLGTQLTTRNLYDAVIGIGNVQIRLYKIEEQREYPITWAEVAQNSGGEGFLSAFVVLSSLLYYMRRDESDIFAERNEGKVLLMDNPFAQTNAAHLLKPLMDIAKKTNTQLICLTGLGGESIYSRFDNIYVLNVVSANLRSGTQYLKGTHLRGKEPSVLEVSQVEVVEQQELVF